MNRRGYALLLVLVSCTSAGCKEATLGPQGRGSIEGQVRDYESGDAVAGASVTTTPPTEALVTDADGLFSMSDVEAGTYQISARGPGYRPNTVSVSVRGDRIAQATIVLETEEEELEPQAAFEVEIVGFWNTTSGDSTFAEAEYRVSNIGTSTIAAYEVYFRIEAGEQAFYHEEAADSLEVGQVDSSRFRLFVPAPSVTDVLVEGTWSDPPRAPPSGEPGG